MDTNVYAYVYIHMVSVCINTDGLFVCPDGYTYMNIDTYM